MEDFTSTNNKEAKMFFDHLQTIPQYVTDEISRSATRSTTKRNENSFSLEVEMPGLSRSDIDISIENDLLTAAGSRESSGRKICYSRSWHLGENIIQESITARYDAGLLLIEVPLSAPRKRKISVE